jgi:hypothetical protein
VIKGVVAVDLELDAGICGSDRMSKKQLAESPPVVSTWGPLTLPPLKNE